MTGPEGSCEAAARSSWRLAWPAGAGAAAAQAPAGVATLAPMLARVTPGVVGISIGQSASRADPLLADPFFKRFFEENAPPRGAPSGESRCARPARA